jgi:hypothetical protein
VQLGAQVGNAPGQKLDWLDCDQSVPKKLNDEKSIITATLNFIRIPLLVRVSLHVESLICFQLLHGEAGVVDDVLVRYGQQIVIQINWLHLWKPVTLLRRQFFGL